MDLKTNILMILRKTVFGQMWPKLRELERISIILCDNTR